MSGVDEDLSDSTLSHSVIKKKTQISFRSQDGVSARRCPDVTPDHMQPMHEFRYLGRS